MKRLADCSGLPPDLTQQSLPSGLNLVDWRRALSAPVFSGLPSEVVREAFKSGRLHSFGDGRQVFSPDRRAEEFLLVLMGRIRLFYLDRDGEERTMRFVGQGELVCPQLEGQDDSLHATFGESVGGLRLLVLPVPRFLQLIREHYPLARNLISQLSNLLERVGQQVCLCQARSAPVLVARYLLECLTENRDILDIRPLHMTAQEVGVARETLSRVLAGLCKQGLIEYSRGQVRIVDRPGLRDLASNL